MSLIGVRRVSAILLNPSLRVQVCGAFRPFASGPFQDKERAEEVNHQAEICRLPCKSRLFVIEAQEAGT
jgi:hypothetical protein